MARATDANDIALGLVATGIRAGATLGRLALLPVRLAARAPVVGPALQRAGEALASDGLEARARSREQLEAATGDLLAAPEVERAVDQALAGPLTDTFARSLAKHRVAERVAAEIAANPEFEQAVADALDHEATQRLVDRALASPGLERLVVEALESRLTAEVFEHLATSPAMRSAMQRQTATLAEEVMSGVRHRAERADDAAQRKIRRKQVAEVPYAGIATRAVGLAIDVLLAQIIFLTGAALVGLVASLVSDLRPEWLVAALAVTGWTLVSGTYFVLFWTAAGQTPGMRLMRLRVSDHHGRPPSLGRSVVRFFGLLLAIVPLFAGFLPVLFDNRRRALQDFMAGTTVLYVDREPLIIETAPATDGDPAAAAKLSL